MFQVPEYYHHVSLRLSEVTDEIGINEKTVLARRRTYLLLESMKNTENRFKNKNLSTYIFGSQSEGTTTVGLQSDTDFLTSINGINVIQDYSEWKPYVKNFLMIQDDTIPPGYCLLQALRKDSPLPLLYNGILPKEHATDIRGKIFLKNISLHKTISVTSTHGPEIDQPGYNNNCQIQTLQSDLLTEESINGPAYTTHTEGFFDKDEVTAFQCKTMPIQARYWTYQQTARGWPSENMKTYAVSTRCFIVPVGSRYSHNEDCQWRISTSLAERCLMFNLNITQLRTFILIKMILKKYINPYFENMLSSYVCKTALFYCIRNTPPSLWQENMLLLCLKTCMMYLCSFVSSRNCPHFMIPENNLLRGKFSHKVKRQLRNTLLHLIHSNGQLLLGIDIDDLGIRLQSKFNVLQDIHTFPQLFTEDCSGIIPSLILTVADAVSYALSVVFRNIANDSDHAAEERLLNLINHFTVTYNDSSILEKRSHYLLLPFLCTTFGSLVVSNGLRTCNNISPYALKWFSLGLSSDAASSRLKLASALYCSGEIEKAKDILEDVEQVYDVSVIESVCKCFNRFHSPRKYNFFIQSNTFARQEEVLRHLTAFCVKFLPCEKNCVPEELQYEMTRSDFEDLPYQYPDDSWMEMAVVDSLPFLHFLLYKTYGHLGRHEEQQQALVKLARCIEYEENLAHRETALNLLGQCFKEQGQLEYALKCYTESLKVRQRHNAAKQHIRRVLSNDANL